MNAYESDLPWPDGTTIRELRIVSLFPKDTYLVDDPPVGLAAQALARGVIGTVPVEADGSAYFTMPTGAAVYFQLLDEQGLAVQTMRSDTYVHPGERLTCIGCHERKTRAAPDLRQPPAALRRAPSTPKPEAAGSYPLTFPRLVQPVLDARCVTCHEEKKTEKAPGLRGDVFVKGTGWSEAFDTMRKSGWGMSGGNGVALREPQYSTPGQVGARASRLYALLAKGHHDVKLTADEMRRITLWLDCNSNFYGAYREQERQARGEIVPPRVGIPPWTPFEILKR
jgi:cytochrome c553